VPFVGFSVAPNFRFIYYGGAAASGVGHDRDNARRVKSVDCSARNLAVNDFVKCPSEVESETCDCAQSSVMQYAGGLYNLAEGGTTSPDKVGDAPRVVSHAHGAPLKFDLDCFRDFDARTITVDPVEPVNSQFGRYGGRCLLLHNVLSQRECEYLIQQMSGDMEAVQYSRDYRRNDRCIFNSPELASLLWSRVERLAQDHNLSLCVDEDPARQHLLHEEAGICPEELRVGYGSEGIWHPIGLNECLRFCRYNPGGFFRAHCDGSFIRSKEEKSLFTCMFYLNGGLIGGATRFLRLDVDRSMDQQCNLAEDDQVLASLAPEAGSCLLFFQPGLLHEGQDLREGSDAKYILRTDVMCRRDPAFAPKLSVTQKEALELLEEATLAEEARAFDRAAALYSRAFRLDPRLERMV